MGITTPYRNAVLSQSFTSKDLAGNQGSSRFIFPGDDTIQLQKYVRVGDKVFLESSGGGAIATVAQVKNRQRGKNSFNRRTKF